MGMAENKKGRTALKSLFKCIKVYTVFALLLYQGNGQGNSSPIFCYIEKFRINRCEKEYGIPLIGKFANHCCQCRNYTGTKRCQLRIKAPAVPFLLPFPYRFEIRIGPWRISEYSLCISLGHCIDDRLGGRKIHIRNPEGNQILPSELLFSFIVFYGVSVPPVCHHIKIVSHIMSSPVFFLYKLCRPVIKVCCII